eukprot:GFUD01022877.1.p1 GENE.GFUD01022877.1~~GFUD01022877.1.p1  ORF type:complete len:360 (+),score=67.74 GFUD01022877.1:174-1253(+)
MSVKYLRRNLRFISCQTEDTIMITTDGEHITTQRHLLSSVSSYLAALLSQTDQVDRMAISVPFSSEVIRDMLDNLASEDEECVEIEQEAFNAAKELGIMFLTQIKESYVKQEVNTDDDDAMKEYTDNDPREFSGDKEYYDELQNKSKDGRNIKSMLTHNGEAKKKNKKVDLAKDDHPGTKPFLCDQCGKGFSAAGARDAHIKTIHADKKLFLCDHCGKDFSTAGNRNTHIQMNHSESALQCPHCELSVKYLSRHIKLVHTVGGEKFTCEECGKKFKLKYHLTKHMNCHLPDELRSVVIAKEKEKHQCTSCGQGFRDKTRLKWHEAAQHTGIRTFHCQHCPKSYFRSDHLKTHVTSTHGL